MAEFSKVVLLYVFANGTGFENADYTTSEGLRDLDKSS